MDTYKSKKEPLLVFELLKTSLFDELSLFL